MFILIVVRCHFKLIKYKKKLQRNYDIFTRLFWYDLHIAKLLHEKLL